LRRGTRAGSVGIYCGNEAVKDAGLDWANIDKSRVGVYIGVTEHGNVETENEVYALKGYNYDTTFWSHHHNPRTVANNPAGEVALNMGITGPHYTIGRRLRCGNAGLIQGAQMLRLGTATWHWPRSLESIHTLAFPSFKARALSPRTKPDEGSRPFIKPATASSWPKGAASTPWSGSTTREPAERRFTAS